MIKSSPEPLAADRQRYVGLCVCHRQPLVGLPALKTTAKVGEKGRLFQVNTSIAWIKKGFCDNFCHGLAMFSSGMLLAGTCAIAQRTQGSEAFAQRKSLLLERNLFISPNKSLQKIKYTGHFHYQMHTV